ncbi:hypothetical protein ILUMI_01849 [Ignelater luminosus]|uniref:Uncharacterized protein n=1 Tax=Ignelater luminosus TaxID=2038154 RepID=A0A8K0GLV3_IGNLU|nr:hypothetical protein ILUMI_01849 [Ignelater luminosus]
MGARCRLCAESYDDLVDALDEAELSTKILQFFRVKIVADDRLPTTICRRCYDAINATWEFNEQVQKAQELLLAVEEANKASLLEQQNKNSVTMVECVLTDTTTEQSKPKIKTKNRRCKKRESVSSDSEGLLSGASDAEWHEDGSITLRRCLDGWDTYPWTCSDCHQTFSTADELRDHHSLTHGQSPKYVCADCPKMYTKYSTFISHVRSHREQLRFCCDICGKWYGTSRAQEQHRATHCDQRPHSCSTCGKRFRVQSSLLVHARSHLPAELKNKHQCDQCPKRFGTKPNLMAHKRIHYGIRDFTCDQCGKSFVQKGNLDNHMLTHTVARPFNCLTCGKAFKTAVRLRKHSSVHSGLKPHQCDVCGRQFRERGTLKEHHRIHTGAMPFTCEYCGKSFRFKGVLTTHRRQHTGERPYSCLECQHHFTNWPNYNKHMKRRHGINTSVTVRKPQSIPPTGMPQRNPPGTVLAPPQPTTVTMLATVPPSAATITDNFPETPPPFYPVLNLYNLPEELLQQRV